MRWLTPYLAALLLLCTPALAQEEESGGFLTSMLEDLLSNENQSIKVIGLEGALSARATLRELQVLDRDGPWLILRGAVLDWNRLALVRGRFSVNELTAQELIVTRAPLPSADPDLPDPEARSEPLSLPELPVAVLIEKLALSRIEFGEALAGQTAQLSLAGGITLADGALDTTLSAERLDRPGDGLRLRAEANNASRAVTLDLDLSEGPGGLLGGLLKLPGAPELSLTAKGAGRYDDLVTQIALTTDGSPRLVGTVELSGTSDTPGTRFTADLSGDLRPLLEDVYDPFFGALSRLTLAGHTAPEGLSIDNLTLDTQALSVTGGMSLAGGQIGALTLDASLGYADQSPVVLPIAGAGHALQSLSIVARANGDNDRWTLGATLGGYASPAARIGTARLIAGGTLQQGDVTELAGDMQLSVDDLGLADPALAAAIGPVLRLAGAVDWHSREDLDLRDVVLDGTGYRADLEATIKGLGANGALSADLSLEAGNLAQFAALAGIDLTGGAVAQASATAELLTGAFDAQATVQASNLQTGIAELDPLLQGDTLLTAEASRDSSGLTLRDLRLRGQALRLDASGTLSSRDADLTLRAGLDDLGRVVPDLPGAVDLRADVTREDGPWEAEIALTAPRDATGRIDATLDGDMAQARLNLSAPDLAGLVPAEVMPLSLSGSAQMQGTEMSAQLDLAGGDSATATVEARMTNGDATAHIDADLSGYGDLPDTLFPLSLEGEATYRDGTAHAMLDLTAAQNAALALTGDLTPDGAVTLVATGDVAALDGVLPPQVTPVTLTARASRAAQGLWSVVADLAAAEFATLDLDGRYTEGGAGEADLSVLVNDAPDLLPPGIAPLTLTGAARLSDAQALTADLLLRGAGDGLSLTARATHDGQETGQVNMDGTVTQLGTLLPTLVLPLDLTLTADLIGQSAQGRADLTAGSLGTFATTAALDADGKTTADLTGAIQSIGLEAADAFLPLTLAAHAERRATGWFASTLDLSGPNASSLKAEARTDPATGRSYVGFDALLNELERILPRFPGQITAKGRARNDGPLWSLDVDLTGPADIAATLDGSYDVASQMADVATKGSLQLGGIDPLISPNQIDGALGFDLALSGAPTLENLRGTVTTQGATLDLPAVGQSVTPINITLDMGRGAAGVNAIVGLAAGGQVAVTGPVGLSPPYSADLTIGLRQLVLTDNLIVRSGASGDLRYSGDILGLSSLAGRIDVAPTTINLANLGGSVSAAPIPEITHVAESASALATRERAGLVVAEDDGRDRPDINLDLLLVAEQGVKVSGMGLNAQLAGGIGIQGTPDALQTSGAIELDSGVFVILGRPLKLTEGRVSLQDSRDVYIDFAASSVNTEGTATIRVEGPLDQPEVNIFSVPERPPEEALALLLFGNRQSQLSPVKIAQLAAQIATGGGSLFGGEVSESDGARNRLLNAREHIYADFTVNNEGQNEVNLSLDLTERMTMRGSVDNAGDTALGLFFQRDY